MELVSKRAKARFKDHDLREIKRGLFNGEDSILFSCKSLSCPNLEKDKSVYFIWLKVGKDIKM